MQGDRYLSLIASLVADIDRLPDSYTPSTFQAILTAMNTKVWSGLCPLLNELVAENAMMNNDRADGAEVMITLASGLDRIQTEWKESRDLDAAIASITSVYHTFQANYEKIMDKLLTRAAAEHGKPMAIGVAEWVERPREEQPLLKELRQHLQKEDSMSNSKKCM